MKYSDRLIDLWRQNQNSELKFALLNRKYNKAFLTIATANLYEESHIFPYPLKNMWK